MSEDRAHRNRALAAALNFLWPGLGLLRIGEAALAMVFAAVPFAVLLLGYAACAAGAMRPADAWPAAALGVLVAAAASAVLAWRRAPFSSSAPRDWWTRWYGLAPLWLAAVAAAVLVPNPDGYAKHFYLPAESMAPTLVKDDRFVGRIGVRPDISRGDIVIVRSPAGPYYVKRVAAFAGERISLRAGIVFLNGRAVAQRPIGSEAGDYGRPVRRLAERFPGEDEEHHIYDAELSEFDDFAEVRVRPGHVFLLGDNRDRSADSRVPQAHGGLEQVPADDVVGRLLFKL
jgi:signal peptidase I